MKTLPPNKSAKELGYKIGDKFIVEDAVGNDELKEGMIVTLLDDVDSLTPFFSSDSFDDNPILLFCLSPLPKSFEALEEGDSVFNSKGEERKILAVIGGTGDTRCYVLSCTGEFKQPTSMIFTAHYLKESEYTLKEECCDGKNCCKGTV